MLYGGDHFDFTKLSEVLKAIGLSESTADACIRYMDEEKTDEALLDGIAPVKINGTMTWEQRRELWSIREKLLMKNEELNSRFINIIFTACGISGAPIIFDGMFYDSLAKGKKIRINALKRRFHDEAEAIELALCAYLYYEEWQRGGRLSTNAPKTYIKAMDMLDKYGNGTSHFISKAALCIAALDSMQPPEENADVKSSPVVKTSCGKLIEIYDKAGNVTAEQYDLVAVGMAEAALFSEKARQIFKSMAEKDVMAIVHYAEKMDIRHKRIMNVIESMPEIINTDYVHYVAEGHSSNIKERLAKLTKYDPKMMRIVLDTEADLKAAVMLQTVIDENDPDFDMKEYDLKDRVQRRAERVLEAYSKDRGEQIRDYIHGKGSYADISAIFKGRSKLNSFSGSKIDYDYYGVFGDDDFFKRIFTINMIASEEDYYFSGNVHHNTGFDPLDKNDKQNDNIKKSMQFMLDAGAPLTDIISCMGSAIDKLYGEAPEKYTRLIIEAAMKYSDLLAGCEPKNMCVRGRIIYVRALSEDTERFREQLVSVTDDSSKLVRAEMIGIFRAHKELADDVKSLLAAKKQAKREVAISVIEAWGKEGFTDELQKALDIEKNEKLKLRIAALIGAEGAAAVIQVDNEEKIKKLMKRVSRLDWLYSSPFAPVHKTDGTEADEDYLKAIMLCYVSMEKLARNSFACELAEVLDKREFEEFAQEVFRRWYDKGAEAKTKWVLYFSAVHGGAVMCRELVKHINEWGNYSAYVQKAVALYQQNSNIMIGMRTAIAGEAVNALAMNGSNEALMAVDNISRKFKGKSVRVAASNAMAAAADGLGITAEELADRIVPDLGFDDDLCRVFDYGKRQFNVYIRPSLELEIFNGDKKVKSMPKPGVTDDAEKANTAYEQFKEMKKLMKTAVTAQKNRLEYVLMCDRKWSVEGWRTLFVKNAIMHCFAIGLIWGIYEEGKLMTTFRYMEDGSFTTSDGDEFELPESAFIGLVHPIELSDELKAEWTEQLSDYEIEQPFPQLSRRIFTPDKNELELKRILRFKGSELGSLSLIGKMTRLGWYKGQAEDAGFFYYFIREDVSSRSVAPDGSTVLKGYGTMLIHSGTSIAAYDMEEDQVTAEEVIFFKAGKSPNYWDKEEKDCIKCSEVPERYFSEIMLQLSSVFGSKEES